VSVGAVVADGVVADGVVADGVVADGVVADGALSGDSGARAGAGPALRPNLGGQSSVPSTSDGASRPGWAHRRRARQSAHGKR
jgi:hypothetical protein